VGSDSTPPFKASYWGGEVALGGCSLRDSAPWLEEEVEVTLLVVLIVIRRNRHHPLAFVQGGWCGCSFNHREGHCCDGRWRGRRVSGVWRGKVLVRDGVGKVLGEGCWRSRRSKFRGWACGVPSSLERSFALGFQGLDKPQPFVLVNFRICTKKANRAEVKHRLKHEATDDSHANKSENKHKQKSKQISGEWFPY